MKTFGLFSVRDLRERPEDLLQGAEAGRLTLITDRGRPAVLAVPFDQRLLEEGVRRGLAVSFFEQRLLTLSRASDWQPSPWAP
jgi:antitoxin (DNA-binding transcriptional repressor) of toxin-antitoxin stability system